MPSVEIPTFSYLYSYQETIVLDNKTYNFFFKFNRRANRWQFDISDQNNDELLVGIPLLTNVDLTIQYRYKDIPQGYFLVYDTEGQQRNPGEFELGDTIKFLYGTL